MTGVGHAVFIGGPFLWPVLLSFSVGEFSTCYSIIAGPGPGNMTYFEPGERAAAACSLFLVSRMFMVVALGYCMTNVLLSAPCPGSIRVLVNPNRRSPLPERPDTQGLPPGLTVFGRWIRASFW